MVRTVLLRMMSKIKTKPATRWAYSLEEKDSVHVKLARSTVLDWQILDEEKPKNDSLPAATNSNPSHSVRRLRPVQVIAGLLLAIAAGTLLYLWRLAEAGAQIVEAELHGAVMADEWLRTPPRISQTSPGALVTAATVQVQGFTFHGKVASVHTETTFTEPNGQTYRMRQRHFYQPSETGWLRVPPNRAVLGERQSRETTYFTFAYYKIDDAAVAATAAEADRMYADLLRDYGLTPVVARRFVEVTAQLPGESPCRPRNQLCLKSPALASLPVGLSETEALQLWFINALAYQVSQTASEATLQREPFHAPFKVGWRHAAYVLPRVQMRRHSSILSARQTALLGWLYSIETRTQKPDAETLAQELAQLCADHQIAAYQFVLAGGVPTDLCLDPPMLDLRYLANHKAPDHLNQLFMPDLDLTVTEPSWIDILAFETVLDYVVVAYGADALPALIDGFQRYDTWNTLVPGVFAVSVEEFERGWQAYLAKIGTLPLALDAHFQTAEPEYLAVIRAAGFQPGWHVLDDGCGSGSFLPALADLVGNTG